MRVNRYRAGVDGRFVSVGVPDAAGGEAAAVS